MTEPFYVGRDNKKFRGVSVDGYLPALELPEEEPAISDEQDIFERMELSARQWDYLKQLKAQVLNLSNKLMELRASKGKGKQYKYTNE